MARDSRAPDGRHLIIYGKPPTELHQRRKWDARNELRSFTALHAQRSCGGYLYAELKEVTLDNGYTYEKGIGRCKVTNSCPWCSPRVYAAKRARLNDAAREAHALGGSLIVATLTLPSRYGQPLSVGYTNLWKVRARFRRKLKLLEQGMGIAMGACVVEETFRAQRRWHAHFHWLWFLPNDWSADHTSEFETKVKALWIQAGMREGVETPRAEAQSFSHALTLPEMEKSIRYVTKHGYYPSSRPRIQFIESHASLKPFEVLELARTGESQYVFAYNEFEVTNKGRSRIQFYGFPSVGPTHS